jgi:polysaccharide biosynthesis/export protein
MSYASQFVLCLLTVPLACTVSAQQAVKSNATASTTLDPAAAPNPTDAERNYVIGPADVLNIDVWKQPDVSRTLPVRPDGKISLPLLEDIQAAGLTPLQLEATISARLIKFVNNPQVTVIVTQVNSQRVYVLGQAMHPGPYPLLPDMTVLQAIAGAGGLAQFAKDKDIYVLRTVNGHQERYPFNYRLALNGKNTQQNIALKSGDTVVIP